MSAQPNENLYIDDRPLSPTLLVSKGVFLEALRRREFYVVLLFMGLFLVGALIVRVVGTENAATASFILNLGLSLSLIFAQVITLLTAARQYPDELEQRTLYPLLAKPLTRGQYVLGKWLACWGAGISVLVLLSAMVLVPAAKPPGFSSLAIGQMLTVQAIGLGALGALTLFGSLVLPKVLNILIMILLVFLGGTFVGLIRSYFAGSALKEVVWWATGYVPDFSRLDLVNRATSAAPVVDVFSFLMRIAYAGAFTVVGLVAASAILKRRSL